MITEQAHKGAESDVQCATDERPLVHGRAADGDDDAGVVQQGEEGTPDYKGGPLAQAAERPLANLDHSSGHLNAGNGRVLQMIHNVIHVEDEGRESLSVGVERSALLPDQNDERLRGPEHDKRVGQACDDGRSLQGTKRGVCVRVVDARIQQSDGRGAFREGPEDPLEHRRVWVTVGGQHIHHERAGIRRGYEVECQNDERKRAQHVGVAPRGVAGDLIEENVRRGPVGQAHGAVLEGDEAIVLLGVGELVVVISGQFFYLTHVVCALSANEINVRGIDKGGIVSAAARNGYPIGGLDALLAVAVDRRVHIAGELHPLAPAIAAVVGVVQHACGGPAHAQVRLRLQIVLCSPVPVARVGLIAEAARVCHALHADALGAPHAEPDDAIEGGHDERGHNEHTKSPALGDPRNKSADERSPGDPPAPVKDGPVDYPRGTATLVDSAEAHVFPAETLPSVAMESNLHDVPQVETSNLHNVVQNEVGLAVQRDNNHQEGPHCEDAL
mmetsp:Transcript_105021/g.282236  ORF Transcript_105021/g.282236 Transcript_105021/m.282236 type:complete len:501 (-) Transcript_105021:122-1624(-)